MRGIDTLRAALEGFRASMDVPGQVLCLAALLNAAQLSYFAIEAMEHWLDELLHRIEQLQTYPSKDVEARVWGVLCSALFWIRPWHPWAVGAARRVEVLLASGVTPSVALAAAASALSTTSTSGEFECGDRIIEATAHLVDDRDASPSEAAWWLVRAGYLRFAEARYEEALDLIRRACHVAERNGMRATLAITIYTRFMVEFRASGWMVANATLAEIEAMPRPKYPVGEAMLYVYQARRAYSRGRLDEAADLAEQTHAAILRTGSQYQEMLFGLVDAEILLAAGRIEKARPLIARSRNLIERAPVFDCFLAALVVAEAWLAYAEGKPDLALAQLRQSLFRARVGNRRCYLRFLECAMPPLFNLALRKGIEVDLVQDIIRMFRLRPPVDAPDNWPWPVRIFTLGCCEAQVNGEKLEFSGKQPRKTLLLLKAIVALGGRDVPEQTLCDLLWGDEEGDAARNALSITVLRLRKLLGSNEAIVHQGGKVSLTPELCWVDAWAFEGRLADPALESAQVLELYRGNF